MTPQFKKYPLRFEREEVDYMIWATLFLQFGYRHPCSTLSRLSCSYETDLGMILHKFHYCFL
jgi:hypothetical protein